MLRGPLLNLGGVFLHPFEPLFLLAAAVAMLLALSRYGLKLELRSRVPLVLFVSGSLLLLASVALSALVSVRAAMTLKAFSKWLEIVTVAFLSFWLGRDKRSREWIYLAFFLSSVLYAFWFLPVSLDFGAWIRFGGYEAVIALILLSGWPGESRWWKRLIQAALVWVALRSLSRGVWLVLALLGFHELRRMSWSRRLVAVSAAVGVTVFLLTVVPQLSFVLQQRFFNPESASNRSRTRLLLAAAEGFAEHPFLGIGAENFPTYMAAKLRVEGVHEKNMSVLQVHNIFLQTAVEEGILGLLGLLLLSSGVGAALWLADRSYWMRKPLMDTGLVFLLMLGLGVLANNIRFLLGLYLGLTLSLMQVESEEKLPEGTE